MTLTAIGNPTNDASRIIDLNRPYVATVKIQGSSTLLFHRWSNEAVEAKSKASKNSAAKKTDDVESYVYRDEEGHICMPGRYLVGMLVDKKNGAAKYKQDPRSPRKSAVDLFKAGVVPLTELAPIYSAGSLEPATEWDLLDRQRVTVQQAGITRERPAFLKGWSCQIDVQVLTPEYIHPDLLLEVISAGGRLVGLGDYRPTYGRFQVIGFSCLNDD